MNDQAFDVFWAGYWPDCTPQTPEIAEAKRCAALVWRAAVAAERERMRERLLEMDEAVNGRHNYYAHAALVLFGPNARLTAPDTAHRRNDE